MRISYSHSSEDIILRRVFSEVKEGFYVDVGAYHPVHDSVTKVFYDDGWSGINIEPNPDFYSLLQRDRPNDQNLELAVSDCKGTKTLYVVGSTGLTSLKAEVATHAVRSPAPAANTKELRTLVVQTDTLSNIWDRHISPDQDVHFLKIDVEGAEIDVLVGCDFGRHRPWVLVIEATAPRTSVPSHHAWEPLVLEARYSYAYFDGLNRYYVAEEKKNLLSLFDRAPNPVVDNFKPFMAYLIEQNAAQQISDLVSENNILKDDIGTMRERTRSLTLEIAELNERNENLIQRLKTSLIKNDELERRTDEQIAGMASTISKMTDKLSLLSLQQRVLLQPNLCKPDNSIKRLINEIDVDDVNAAFSLLLKRRPESRSTVQYHLHLQTIDKLIETLINSDEFKQRESRSQSSYWASLVSYIQSCWRRLQATIKDVSVGTSRGLEARLSQRERKYLSKLRAE